MKRSRTHATNTVLLLASVGLGGGAFAGLLPARMGLLPPLSIFIEVLLYGAAWLIQRFPSHVNMLNQAAYDALSEEDQKKVIACQLPFFYWSVTLWTAYGIFSCLFPAPVVAPIVGLVLASIANIAITVRFLSHANRKMSELHEATQDRSG